MDLKTTTRPNRHTAELRAVRGLLGSTDGNRTFNVANVGPGLAVKYLGRLAEETRPGWDIVKRIESGIRRIPMPDAFYETYETREVVAALEGLLFSLTVIDINPRVLRIVQTQGPTAHLSVVAADLGEGRPAGLVPLLGSFDLVIAIAVLGRVQRTGKDNAAANLLSLVKPGGLLLATGEFQSPEFHPVPGHPLIFRRSLS